MANRVALPATESNGQAWTTAYIDRLPGGVIGYSSATSDQGSITSQVDVTGLSVTVPVNSSRMIKIEAFVVLLKDTTAAQCNVCIQEGVTQLQIAQQDIAASKIQTFTPFVLLTAPSAGNHTYKVQALSGAGAMTSKAGSTSAAWIIVTDEGPSF